MRGGGQWAFEIFPKIHRFWLVTRPLDPSILLRIFVICNKYELIFLKALESLAVFMCSCIYSHSVYTISSRQQPQQLLVIMVCMVFNEQCFFHGGCRTFCRALRRLLVRRWFERIPSVLYLGCNWSCCTYSYNLPCVHCKGIRASLSLTYDNTLTHF